MNTRIYALLLGLWLAWSGTAQAVTYWEETFENHLHPNWVGGGNCIDAGSPDGVACPYPRITTAQAYNGTHSLLSHYQTAGVEAGTFEDRQVTSTRVLWTRQYARWDNFTFGPENSKFFFACGDAGSACVVWINQNAGNEMSALVNHTTNVTCPNSSVDVTCNYDPNLASVPLDDGQWHCIETHQDFGTSGVANGSLDLYVDGVQTLHYGSILMDTNNLPVTFVRSYAQYGHGDRYQDDWAVGNTRIGCDAAAGGGSTIVLFLSQSAIAISTFLQVLFIGGYFWERRSTAVNAAVKFWRYAVEVPTPKEMYWAYRYKKAVKRWQKQAPLMLEHQPMQTIEVPKMHDRIEH